LIIINNKITDTFKQKIKLYSFESPVLILDINKKDKYMKKILEEIEDGIMIDNKISNENEEIIINYEVKNDTFIGNEIKKSINWIINKQNGLYYEIEKKNKNFIIENLFGKNYLITEDKDLLNNKKNIDIYVIINDIKTKNYELYNKKGQLIEKNGLVELLIIPKYLTKYYNLSNGIINNYNYTNINDIIKLEMKSLPIQSNMGSNYMNDLTNLVFQLSGINIMSMNKFYINNKNYLVLEINESLNDIDNEIINTLGSIINSENDNFYISFINIINNDEIKLKFYNEDNNLYLDSFLGIMDYYSNINEISYDDDFEINVFLNNNVIKIIYNNNKYYVKY
jgi:hypothetical protein